MLEDNLMTFSQGQGDLAKWGYKWRGGWGMFKKF